MDLKVIYDQQRKESFSKPSSAGTPYHSFSDLDEPSIDSKAARGSQLRRIESIPEEFAESAYEEIEEEPQLHSLYLDADEVSDETKEFT